MREKLLMGVKTLPLLEKDDCDRNRTSPFAFTGNKFELRMPGSSQSVGFCNTVLNTMVADSLNYIADELAGKKDVAHAAYALVGRIYSDNKRIIFNGNNYSDEWREESARRGLVEYKTTVDVAPAYLVTKNIRLFASLSVLTESECRSRYEIMLENYVKLISIEAETMAELVTRQVLPACAKHAARLSQDVASFAAAGNVCAFAKSASSELCSLCDQIDASLRDLTARYEKLPSARSAEDGAAACKDIVTVAMPQLRCCCDRAEKLVPAESWPLPSYSDMLFKQ